MNIRPIICEIEGDLPNVISKFANSNENYFLSCIEESAQKATLVLQNRYPFVNVQGGNFQSLMTSINEDRHYIEATIRNLEIDGGLPEQFQAQLEFVANNRNFMFQNLYGASTSEEFYQLARRQMVNYLAVSRSLASALPNGCVVLNMQTPNSVYVKQAPRLLNPILGITEKILPIFYFF